MSIALGGSVLSRLELALGVLGLGLGLGLGLAYLALDMLPACELRLLASCQRTAQVFSFNCNSHLSTKLSYIVL